MRYSVKNVIEDTRTGYFHADVVRHTDEGTHTVGQVGNEGMGGSHTYYFPDAAEQRSFQQAADEAFPEVEFERCDFYVVRLLTHAELDRKRNRIVVDGRDGEQAFWETGRAYLARTNADVQALIRDVAEPLVWDKRTHEFTPLTK